MDPFEIMRLFSFLFVTFAGLLGNSALLSFYVCSAYKENGLVTSDVILVNLTAYNLVMLLTRGLPNILFIFGLANVLSDAHCQLLVYTSRVCRAMSICLTCFLSCFQCVTIMSTSSTCMSVRLRLQANVGPIILFLLIMNGTMCIAPLLFTVSGTNVTNLEYAFRVSYCIVILPDKASLVSNNFILFARDFVFVTGMSVASGSMLFTLYKHRKQVKGIRSAERTQALCAEVRASKMVSALVALYVLFFGIDNSIWFYQNTSPKNILTSTSEIRSFFSVCYASVFPFIIVFFSRKLLLSIRRYTKEKHHISKGISAITIAK